MIKWLRINQYFYHQFSISFTGKRFHNSCIKELETENFASLIDDIDEIKYFPECNYNLSSGLDNIYEDF